METALNSNAQPNPINLKAQLDARIPLTDFAKPQKRIPPPIIGELILWIRKSDERGTIVKVTIYTLSFFTSIILCISGVGIPFFLICYNEFVDQNQAASEKNRIDQAWKKFQTENFPAIEQREIICYELGFQASKTDHDSLLVEQLRPLLKKDIIEQLKRQCEDGEAKIKKLMKMQQEIAFQIKGVKEEMHTLERSPSIERSSSYEKQEEITLQTEMNMKRFERSPSDESKRSSHKRLTSVTKDRKCLSLDNIPLYEKTNSKDSDLN